jgi:hypothetical protein
MCGNRQGNTPLDYLSIVSKKSIALCAADRGGRRGFHILENRLTAVK